MRINLEARVALSATSGVTRSAGRKAANVTLPEPLLAEAKALGVNLSQACERGLAETVAEARARKWLNDNRAGIEAWNEYVEANGVPLAEFRQF